MSLLQLDASSIIARYRSSPTRPPPGLEASIARGVLGFTLNSIAGFVPWAVFGHRLHPVVGEAGMYGACAVVFIVLSGLFLHRLIIGPGSLWRFYGLFTPAFTLYAFACMVCFMTLRWHYGGIIGLLGGTALMGAVFAFAFEAWPQFPAVVAALFLGNAAGYFGGGWVEAQVVMHYRTTAMLLWGVCYGLGLGLGLGVAFYLCQTRARALLAGPQP